MKRDASVTETHHLCIQLLRKREWQSGEGVRIGHIDIIPMDQVADNSRDWLEWVGKNMEFPHDGALENRDRCFFPERRSPLSARLRMLEYAE
jgi:hypothetical protein